MSLSEITSSITEGSQLSPEQIASCVDALTSPDITPETKADFLGHLSNRGETAAEIGEFAKILREKAVSVPLPDSLRNSSTILDVCGTGGDKLGTINVSTAVGLLAAAAGVHVAKHGNRAITSKSGSADVLIALGIPIDLSPEEAAKSIVEHHFAFLFAPNYHPAFKHIVPARKICAERGQRTIFNFLGPLLNPAKPSAQLLGVSNANLTAHMAKALQGLGLQRAMVVSGQVGDAVMDEISIHGSTTIAEFYQNRGFSESTLDPSNFDLTPSQIEDLSGGDAEENAAMLRQILEGRDTGPKSEIVRINAAAALFVASACDSMAAGWDLATETIRSGKASAKLAELSGH